MHSMLMIIHWVSCHEQTDRQTRGSIATGSLHELCISGATETSMVICCPEYKLQWEYIYNDYMKRLHSTCSSLAINPTLHHFRDMDSAETPQQIVCCTDVNSESLSVTQGHQSRITYQFLYLFFIFIFYGFTINLFRCKIYDHRPGTKLHMDIKFQLQVVCMSYLLTPTTTIILSPQLFSLFLVLHNIWQFCFFL